MAKINPAFAQGSRYGNIDQTLVNSLHSQLIVK